MLEVPGVAELKYQRYGEPFLAAIRAFLEAHPGQTTTTEPVTPPSPEKSEKPPFFLTAQAVDSLSFPEMAYVSELRDILNAAAEGNGCRKLFGTNLTAKLEEAGCIATETQGSCSIFHVTDLGNASGIQAERRVSQKGTVYYVLRLPESIQRWAAQQFVR